MACRGQIFAIQQAIEKCVNTVKEFYYMLVDLANAYDKPELCNVLHKQGLESYLLNVRGI